jgi:hypothetical protein
MRLATFLHLVQTLRMDGSVPPLPLFTFMACVVTHLPFILHAAYQTLLNREAAAKHNIGCQMLLNNISILASGTAHKGRDRPSCTQKICQGTGSS